MQRKASAEVSMPKKYQTVKIKVSKEIHRETEGNHFDTQLPVLLQWLLGTVGILKGDQK